MDKKLPSRSLLIFILGAFDTIAPLTIDMYLPAFSKMAADFHTTEARVSLSLTSYFIGLGIGQIFYGPLLDRFGRQRPLVAGMILYIIACAGCALSTTVEMLIAFRFVQALGGCAAAVGVRAMIRDYFPPEEAAKIFSYMMLILAVSPLLAPSIGGLIVTRFDWPWVFAVLAAIVAVIVLIMFIFLPEGHAPDPTVSLALGPMIATFRMILKNRKFLVYTLATSFTFGGLFIYLAGSTVILLGEFKVSPGSYALLFALQSVGLVAGNQLNIMLLKRFRSEPLYRVALIVQTVSSGVFLLGAILGWYSVEVIIFFFFIQLACLGMTFPNGTAIALSPFTQNLGSASSLMGFIQIAIAGPVSAMVGILNASTSLPIAIMLFLSSLVALGVLLAGTRGDART